MGVITVSELFDSRSGDEDQQTLRFVIEGTNDDAAVFTAVAEESPPTHNGKQRKSIEIEPQGDQLWFAEVEYELPGVQWPEPEGGSETVYAPEVSFDTTGGTHHIEHSLQTMGAHQADGYVNQPPDFGGLIGVNDGEVAGLDVIVPKLEWTERHYFTPGAITWAYIKLLSAATGSVNLIPWRQFAGGEVLFMGARGQRDKPEMWTVEFGFAAMQNAVNLQVGDINVPVKKGWHHLWVHVKEEVDTDAKVIVKKPKVAYVEKVYPENNFSTLNLVEPVMGR